MLKDIAMTGSTEEYYEIDFKPQQEMSNDTYVLFPDTWLT